VTAAPTPRPVTLTELARHSVGQLTHVPYRSADTGAWCSPDVPHVAGCTCPPGAAGCDTCWGAYLHHAATAAGST